MPEVNEPTSRVVVPSVTRKAVAPRNSCVSRRPPAPKRPKAAGKDEPREAVPEKVSVLTIVSVPRVTAELTPAFWPWNQPPTPSPRAPRGVVLSSPEASARK